MNEFVYILAGIVTIGWILLLIYKSKYPTTKED